MKFSELGKLARKFGLKDHRCSKDALVNLVRSARWKERYESLRGREREDFVRPDGLVFVDWPQKTAKKPVKKAKTATSA